MTEGQRYAKDWDEYSRAWDTQFGTQYQHLGDEWNDAGSPYDRDAYYFATYAARWLKPDQTVLEIGPGGGKWTVRIAPKVDKVLALDASSEMLQRTRERCESLDIGNVECILGNGKDFQPVPDGMVDFVFSYDVFVHIALEDTWVYAQEMARVLKPGGMGVCHHAINTTHQAWERIEQNNDWYRATGRTLGQFYYYSADALAKMYEHCGLYMMEQHIDGPTCTCVFTKPNSNVIPRLEQSLRGLISMDADDERVRASIVAELRSLQADFARLLDDLLEKANAESNWAARVHYASTIRRLWRGI